MSTDYGTVLSNSINAGFASNVLRYVAIFTAYQVVVYRGAVREREQRAAQLEVDLAHAKLASLEACLRPHFLFNTLNAIAALVREDPKAAEKMIGELSDLLRASLYSEPTREVRLERLPPDQFVRVHRSAIVRIDAILEIQPLFKGDYTLVLKNGTRLRSGRAHRSAIQTLLRGL